MQAEILVRRLTMAIIAKISPDLFRVSIYVPDLDLQYNHFSVRDLQSLLFRVGL